MFVWGINYSWMKIIVKSGDALTIQGVRVFVGALTVFLLLAILRQKIWVKKMPWKFIVLGSFFGVVCHHGFFAYGIGQTTAMKATIIGGLSPLLTAFVAVIFRDTVMTGQKLLGFLLGGAGVLIAVMTSFSELLHWQRGDFFLFLSFFLQSFSFIAIRKATRDIKPIVVTAWMLLIGSLALIVLALFIKPSNFTVFTTMEPKVWMYFFLSAVFSTGVAHTLYNLSIKNIGAAESAIFANFSTLFGLICSAIILGEVLTHQQLLGCLFIIIGVLVGTGNVEKWIRIRQAKKHV